jgi:hypothetical protein
MDNAIKLGYKFEILYYGDIHLKVKTFLVILLMIYIL